MIDSTQTPNYFWRSLRFFCFYRLAVALVLLVLAASFSDVVNVGAYNLALFQRANLVYVLGAIALIILIHRRQPSFSAQLTVQMLFDITLITLLMYASGGQKSGLAVLLLISLAGAGLVGEGRMVLFFAAMASLAILIEQGLRTLGLDADPGEFFRTGLVCLSFFGMAITARLLARRVVANEELARARGLALDRQLAIGQRIIADMTDGVLVLDERGRVQQWNAMAERLLSRVSKESQLSDWSPHLMRQLWLGAAAKGNDVTRDLAEVVRSREGKLLRLRLLPASEQGGDSVVYIEDMERVQIQAQQLKLAALGRLTANIAHEVRNPLAAISHAAELLGEDETDPIRKRLATIVGDNSIRLNRLVTDVLELGRRDRATPEVLHWPSFASEFREEFLLHDASAATRLSLSDTDVRLRFDRSHLHRVIWNLVANALRHASAAAGAVQVQVRVGEGNGSVVEVHVMDDGPGIAEALRQQMFEPFVTSHGSGTGLGLYIARELCDANAARLELVDPAASPADEYAAMAGAHFVIQMERVV